LPAIAGEADDVELGETMHDPCRPVEIEQVNVIVDEHKDGGIGGGLADGRVVDTRQPAGVFRK
jgi:hypothetical protein